MSDRGRLSWSVTRLATAGAGLLIVAACLESSVVQLTLDDLVELTLDPDSADVIVERTLQVQPLALDARGTLLVGLDMTWTSLDPSVATVDADGTVTGVATGSTQVVVTAATLTDTAVIVVVEPPSLVLSAASSTLSGEAGGADSPPDTIGITNGGGAQLAGLAVDSIVYNEATAGWLTASLGAAVAPTELVLVGVSSTIFTEGTYTATVWLSAAEAVGSPASVDVVFEVAPGPVYGDPANFEVVAGGGETAVTGAEVETDPIVRVTDVDDNPVPGVTVTFTPSGGGSVGSTTVQTDSDGEASTPWTVSADGHTMATDGTFQNTLIVSAPDLTSQQLTGFARYSYSADVSPRFSACAGCHGNFVFALNYASLVGVASNCGGAPFPRVSTAGGDAGVAASMLLIHTRAGGTPPCGFTDHPEFGDDRVDVFEAWVRNSAPNN